MNLNDPAKAHGPKEFRFTIDMQMFVPLSPRVLLYGDFKGRIDGVGSISAAQVEIINQRQLEQAYEQVYASFRSDELQGLMEKVFREREPLIPSLPKGMLE